MSAIDSSSSSAFLRENLKTSQSIKEEGLDQSSILDCLQNKINELLHFQEEAISLKAQLKIAKETCDLQEAEFSFQKKEMQAEIDHLKEVERNLRITLQSAEAKKNYSKVDVEARIKQESSEIAQLSAKLEKTKRKKSILKSENDSLKDQLSQIEMQVHDLSTENSNLKNDISGLTESLQQERESSKMISEDQTKLNERSVRMGKDIESLQNEKEQLQTQLSRMGRDLKSKSEANKSLKSTMQDNEQQQQALVDSLRKQIIDLKAKNSNLELSLKKAENDNTKLKEKAIDLTSTNQTIQDSKDTTAKRISDLEFENKELSQKVELQAKQLKGYEEMKTENHNQKSLLDHIELERQNLANLLNVKMDPVEGTWTNFVEKITDAIGKEALVNSVENQNEKLKTRLKRALDVSSNAEQMKIQNQQKQTEEEDQYVTALKQTLEKSQERIEACENKINDLKFQQLFASAIEAANSVLMKEVTKIHLTINPTEDTTRSLILAVIFARRMLLMKKSNSLPNPKALLCFKGRDSKSPISMINGIKNYIASMSQDLVDSKKQLVQAIEMREKLILENETLKTTVQTLQDELKLSKKRTRFLKKRMIELQQELALLVPPEEYQKACQLVKDSEQKVQDLRDQISQLKKLMEETQKNDAKLQQEKELLERKVAQNADYANDVHEQMLQKEKELETLRLLLSEKNKEILALERIVHRQKSIEKTATAAFANLALGEKTNIAFDPKVETATLCNQEPSYSLNINPAFLN